MRARQSWEAWQAHGAWITATQPTMGRGIAARFAAGAQVTIDEVELADELRAAVRQRVIDATDGGTVLVLPAAAGAAPPIASDSPATRAAHEAQRLATLRLTCIAGLAGAPVLVVPLARIDGLPLGVAFLGAPGSDRRMLAWARDTFSRHATTGVPT
jgi:amidase